MNILRSALTGAITVPILFAICWAGAAMGLTQIHMFISLFTAQAVGSVGALIESVLGRSRLEPVRARSLR